MADTGAASSSGGEIYETEHNLPDDLSGSIGHEPRSSVVSVPFLHSLRSRGFSIGNAQRPGGQGFGTSGQSASPRLHNGSPAILEDDYSAAIASPNLYSSRSASKRFPNPSMYNDEDEASHWNGPRNGHPRQYINGPTNGSRSPNLERPVESPHYRSQTPAMGFEKDIHTTSRTRLLPDIGHASLIWRKRRKKWLRDMQRLASRYARTASRPKLSLLLPATLLLLYLYLKARSSRSTVILPVPQPVRRATTTRQAIVLPERKWWQRAEAARTTPTDRSKRTTFVSPRHTLAQLQHIPSQYVHNASLSDRMPYVEAIVDCTNADLTDDAQFFVNLDAYMQAIGLSRLPFLTADVLVPRSFDYSSARRITDQQLYKLYRTSSARQHIFDIAQSYSGFLLLLACPTERISQASFSSSEGSTTIETLLRVAGSEEYAGNVLALAGFSSTKQPTDRATRLVPRSANAQMESEGPVRPISVSIKLRYATAPMFFHSSWLNALEAGWSEETGSHLDTTSYIGSRLAGSRGVYGLPIPNRLEIHPAFSHRLQEVQSLLDSQLSHSGVSEAPLIEAEGSAAKVAIFLADADVHNADWEYLVCSLHNKQMYGHEVQVFLPTGSPSLHAGSMLGACPEVIYRRITEERLTRFGPDICLVSEESSISVHTGCVRIVAPTSEVRHLEWLPTLPVESLRNWHTPQVDLVVITNDRPASLYRLLASLWSAHYLSDKPNLFVNMEQTADLATESLLSDAQWPFGQLVVRRRVIHAGLLPAIVESWYPSSNDSYAVLLEDDTEVSPRFYSWLKYSILKHRYGPQHTREHAKRLVGVSLYQPKNLELRPEGRVRFDAHQMFAELGIPPTMPYLSQIPCSWGAVYFPEHWREFHRFLSLRMSETSLDMTEPIIPDIRSNRWPKSWKRYLNELIYLRGYTMLYPNFEDFRSLSTNHLELGTHVRDDDLAARRRELFEVPLLSSEHSLLDGLPGSTLPSWSAMPVLDFWGGLLTEDELVERASITIAELALCPTPEPNEVQGLDRPAMPLTFNADDLLCPREPLNEDSANEQLSLEEREARVAEKEARLASSIAVGRQAVVLDQV